VRSLVRIALLLAVFASVASCAADVGPPLSVRVSWAGLTDPSQAIPMGVTQLTVLVYTGAADDPQMSINTVGGLMDTDMNGRPELVRGDLPTGVPIRMTIRGEGAGNALLFLGHAGPFTLEAGERRYVDLRMYSVGAYTQLDGSTIGGRMLSTTTTLPDGRVLVAGGFSRAMPGTCHGTYAMGTHCFTLTGSTDAFVFDPASGRFFAVHGGLHQARGGHTATALDGGRVLIAGGSASAELALVPTTGGNVPMLSALDDGGPAPTSFEIFEPDANAEPVDVDRNGDPGRGGFVGAADDPTMLGRLDTGRFMHAAIAVPGHGAQVLLVGGTATAASTTWSLYDDQRAGGYGVVSTPMNTLNVARTMPGVAVVHGTSADEVWIFGGAAASSAADLAEVWTSATTRTTPAAGLMMRAFPGPAYAAMPMGTMPAIAQLALMRPSTASLDAGHAVVIGWYGPQCANGAGTPTFPDASGLCDGMTCAPCGADTTNSRNFTLTGNTGNAAPTATRNAHTFGAAVRMTGGTVLTTGGVVGFGLQTTNTSDHFNATVGASGAAQESDVRPLLMQGRAFHSMAALDDDGVLVFGGALFATDGSAVTLFGAPEVLYLPRP
jgi:hypothetical protein